MPAKNDDPLVFVRRARLQRDRAETMFRDAVYRASLEGHSLRVIARAANLSHVRILQILREQ